MGERKRRCPQFTFPVASSPVLGPRGLDGFNVVVVEGASSTGGEEGSPTLGDELLTKPSANCAISGEAPVTLRSHRGAGCSRLGEEPELLAKSTKSWGTEKIPRPNPRA